MIKGDLRKFLFKTSTHSMLYENHVYSPNCKLASVAAYYIFIMVKIFGITMRKRGYHNVGKIRILFQH